MGVRSVSALRSLCATDEFNAVGTGATPRAEVSPDPRGLTPQGGHHDRSVMRVPNPAELKL